MAWALAISLASVSLSVILLVIAFMFDKENKGIKTLMLMMSVASLMLIAGIMDVIVNTYATGNELVNLSLMTYSSLIITITIFSFMLLYFFITYTRDYFKMLRDVKKREREE